MPATETCQPCCTTTAVTTNVPGSDGQSAYTTTTANFTIPAIGATVVVSMGNTDWFAVGAVLFLSDGTDWGHFEVQSIGSQTQATLEFLGQTNDAAPAAVIGSGAKVVAGGTQENIDDPLLIANGGTGATTQAGALSNILGGAPLPIASGGTAGATKAAAIAALGVGQTPTTDANAGLSYDITNAAAQITGVSATVPATGAYLCLAVVTVDYSGTTFAANRTLTLTIRNATAGANLVSVARNTEAFTTTSQPSIDYTLFVASSLTAADAIQVFISLDTVESAGTSRVSACNLILIPIAI